MIRLTLVALVIASGAQAACRDDVVELRGEWGSARFTVDVADEPDERSQGLMNVPEMAASRGMLFIYDAPQRATFWMENTLIPLDMIFAAPDGTVTHVHENAVPLDRTIIDGGQGVQYVLEINGGLSSRIGIGVGDALRHPGIDQEAAVWPCD
ncbi:MAG: DUF192 domain-containing protein [Pseudomonadota bacterium]